MLCAIHVRFFMSSRWTGSWTGGHVYSVREDADHLVSFCSDLKADCWSTATGAHKWDGTVRLTFHRCKPYPDVNKTFVRQASTSALTISRASVGATPHALCGLHSLRSHFGCCLLLEIRFCA